MLNKNTFFYGINVNNNFWIKIETWLCKYSQNIFLKITFYWSLFVFQIIGYLWIRNSHSWLRKRYSYFFAWFGKFSLELLLHNTTFGLEIIPEVKWKSIERPTKRLKNLLELLLPMTFKFQISNIKPLAAHRHVLLIRNYCKVNYYIQMTVYRNIFLQKCW